MRLEFINRVYEGEILGKNIFTNDGGILLRAGVKLTDHYINKLKQLGVLYLYIKDEQLEDVDVEDIHFAKIKQVAMKSINNIIKNIHQCNYKKTKDSLNVIENLIDYIIEEGDVNKSLYDIKTYDNYTYVHCVDTGIMSGFLGLSLNFREYDLKELGKGAILHDIGKTQVPLKILNKNGPLNDEEFAEIKKHPIYGKNILKKNFSISDVVLNVVEQHHERVDGTGYPYGLKGNSISKHGKVACICDVYDALSSDRCYRKKIKPNEVYEFILGQSEKMFDCDIVQKFKETFSIFPLGCCVKLSNGIEGYVVKQNKGFPDRPIIRVIYNFKTKESISFYEINLLKNLDVTITSVV
ncbi:HD-GYP domain-containing protein [Clostridium botulinum C]|uniref:HD-GYP domain-containing protein n=2 Tax=Clostridium botulinum TaxID=1491 RepID=A0A9Q4TJ75_CLOBO|nr:HD-GYP domain-containing protein [Clostridium botulinum]MCD3193740.1 HD-GYP domain-containing protein [Clostridium botulinum C]MCD3199808.1 HD-GYP domain-containing protein [Clostridium botulinum C]MCD3205283.1 HD-GYP domain-containing protein [Clostridium botulinum C]MCD3207209.1 HD-GYP domain-containing protein [Clostridium botulinum C]MCD3224611.1 HD-GYP domain-containing protein [Clostridium botulinum C]